jgi:creatinine amidohydrolase/Fe(II)-dependent formamide hydrolase-like protein
MLKSDIRGVKLPVGERAPHRADDVAGGRPADRRGRGRGADPNAEEAETSLAIALGQRVEVDRATRDAWDRGSAVKDAGFQWTSFGQYGMRHAGPRVVVPMDMLRDITESGVVGDATRASAETGRRVLDVLIPRIVQVCREMAGKE